MELFNRRIIIDNWGTVFLGLKKEWLTIKEVFNFCETGYVICNEKRLIDLRLAYADSLFDFFELLKKFIVEDRQLPIFWNEDSTKNDFSVIPPSYWDFWELEFLLRIINSEGEKEKKLHQVDLLHSDFNYPASWHNFIYFIPAKSNDPIGIDGLYANLITYAEEKIKCLSTLTI